MSDHDPQPPPHDPQPGTPPVQPGPGRPPAPPGPWVQPAGPAPWTQPTPPAAWGQPVPPGAWVPPGQWPAPAPPSHVGATVAAVLIGLGLVPLAVVTVFAAWGAEQVAVAGAGDIGFSPWLVVAGLVALLGAGPSALIAYIPRSPAVRTAGRTWMIAAGVAAGLSLLRLVPMVHHELYLAVFTLVTGLLAWWIGRGAAPGGGDRWFAVAAGLAVLVPWLWVGALGGFLETILAAAAAASVGWLAAGLLGARFWPAYGPGPVKRVLLGGSVAGLALLLLAVGTAQSGSQLAEVLVLPPLGYVLAALSIRTPADGATGGTAWLVGLAAFGPIAFTDPEEVTLLLTTGTDVPAWTAVAAAASWVVAVLVGVVYAVGLARLRPRRWAGAITAAVVAVAAIGVHVVPGRPGLYGERLFVVLEQQADLSGITGTGPDARTARVAEVYRRLVSTAERSQADLRESLDRWHLPYTPYYLVNAIEVAGGPEVRAWLAARDDVDRVLVAQQLRPLVAPPGGTDTGTLPAPATPSWNLTSIRADRVVSELKVTGSGITVGSSDSGVDGTHPALAATFRGGDDSWYDPWDGTRTPTDGAGHGTHTLASAVGAQNVGVAPGADWTGCVNLDRNLGDPGHYLDCLQFMFAPFPAGGDPFTQGRPQRAPQVLTNSWGCPDIEGCDAGALRPATAAFAAAGTYFVAAAGNSGPRCRTVEDPPSPYPDVLTVGAVNEQGRVAEFSSRGPTPDGAVKPDVMAPGEDVLSALPGGGYGTLSGTSMAAPHVAGVVALMWSAQPKLVGDLAGTTRLLQETAAPVTDPGSTCGGAGGGRVDAYAAVRAAQAIG